LSSGPLPLGATRGHLSEEWAFLEVMYVGHPPKALVKLGGMLVTLEEIVAHELLHVLYALREGINPLPSAPADDNLFNRVTHWSDQLVIDGSVFEGLPASSNFREEFEKQWDEGRSDEVPVIAPLLRADDGTPLGDGLFTGKLLTTPEMGSTPLPFDLFNCKGVVLGNLGGYFLRFGHGTAAKVRFMLERKITVGCGTDGEKAEKEDEFLRATAIPFYAKLLKKSVDEVIKNLPVVSSSNPGPRPESISFPEGAGKE
jgi:hypothetical protein